MDGDACALAGGVEALEGRLAVEVGVDAPHVVMRARPRDQLVDRVDPGEDHAQLARPVQTLDDLLGAQMTQVEQDVAVHAAALVDLDLLGPGDDVAARQLHGVRRVVLEEPLALGVQQVRALSPAALGDEHPRRRERGRVELHHLHVLQGTPMQARQRHAVAGAGVGVRRPREAGRPRR